MCVCIYIYIVTFVGALDKADAGKRCTQKKKIMKTTKTSAKKRLEHVRGNLLPGALAQGKKKKRKREREKKRKSSPGGC